MFELSQFVKQFQNWNSLGTNYLIYLFKIVEFM